MHFVCRDFVLNDLVLIDEMDVKGRDLVFFLRPEIQCKRVV